MFFYIYAQKISLSTCTKKKWPFRTTGFNPTNQSNT